MRRTTKPGFAVAALICLLAAYPAARLSAWLFAPRDDLLGYGGLLAGIAGLTGTLLLGLVLGSVAIYRRESPRMLSWAGAASNLGGIVLLVLLMYRMRA